MSLRITGNRLLKTPSGQDTRPTPARVREALFNIWQGEIAGCRWLDLCSGSGALGAEALCRGAAIVIGVEKSGRVCQIIKQNWQRVAQPAQQFQVIRADALQQLALLAGQQFDRIYFDPPYASGLYSPGLEAIARHQLLAQTGELAVEHDSRCWCAEEDCHLEICRQKTYGSTTLTFYRPVTSPVERQLSATT